MARIARGVRRPRARGRGRGHARARRDLACQPHVPDRPARLPGTPGRGARGARRRGVALEVVGAASSRRRALAELDDETLRELSLGGGPYLLFECPFSPRLRRSRAADPRPPAPRLAHPACPPGALRRVPPLARAPCAARLRRRARAGHGRLARRPFGETARRFSVDALREGLVHVLASDAHDAIDRPPGMAAGLAAAEHEPAGHRRPGRVAHRRGPGGDPRRRRASLRAPRSPRPRPALPARLGLIRPT